MNRCLPLTLLLLLPLGPGCKKPEPLPVIVPCPEPPLVEEPGYRTDALTPDTTAEALIRALTLDFLETRSRLREAITILNGYRKPKPEGVTP